MDTHDLTQEIHQAFPLVEMPSRADLALHRNDCAECRALADDLDQYRGKQIGPDVIRLIYQELPHLSAKAWQWLLPHYLRFSLSMDAQYSRVETEFLVYNLGPDLKFQAATLQRLSLLSRKQIDCLTHFLEWCSANEFWRDYFPESIDKALSFLRTIRPTGSATWD